jgi:hypothetical protein
MLNTSARSRLRAPRERKLTATEFRLAIQGFKEQIPSAPTRRARARLLEAALYLHIRQQRSVVPFFCLHSIAPLAYDLLLRPEQRERVREQIECYPASLEHFLVWKHEISPDDPLFEKALALVRPMKEHRSSYHIPLRSCATCFGELVAVELARGHREELVM